MKSAILTTFVTLTSFAASAQELRLSCQATLSVDDGVEERIVLDDTREIKIADGITGLSGIVVTDGKSSYNYMVEVDQGKIKLLSIEDENTRKGFSTESSTESFHTSIPDSSAGKTFDLKCRIKN